MKNKINLVHNLLVSILLSTTIFSQEGWVQQTSGTICNLYSVSFGDANTGCAVGSCIVGNTLLNTTNGGLDWVANSYSGLSSVQLIDEYMGWAVGGDYYGGKIRKTSDGGLNWDSQLSLGNDYFASVCFLNETVGYASGIHIDLNTYGTVFKTTNGGEDWFRKLSLYGSEILRSVYFVNHDLGWVAGQYGKISKTTDGGSSWEEQISGTNNTLHSIRFIDQNIGWAVGNDGTILHTTNGGVTFIEEVDKVPKDFLLAQNYPNPFNPSTKIKYSIPSVGTRDRVSVQMIVYDVLGNEVATLVNEQKPPGTYEVEFDGISLPSGIYFYQLLVTALQSKDGKADSFIETKKMILLK